MWSNRRPGAQRMRRSVRRAWWLGCVVLAVIGVLYLARTNVLQFGARRPRLDGTKRSSARVAESTPVAGTASTGVAPQPGSRDPGASLERAQAPGRQPRLPARG